MGRTSNWASVAKGAAVVAFLATAAKNAGAMEIVAGGAPSGAVHVTLIAAAPTPEDMRLRAARGKSMKAQASRTARVNRNLGAGVNANRGARVSGARQGRPGNGPNHPPTIQAARPSLAKDAKPPVLQDVKVPVVPGAKPPVAQGAKPPLAAGPWVRPGWYHWAPGGAIAAGVAVGFVTAAVATWATPPQPGLCWYYTDTGHQDGFWDNCP